MARKIRIVGLGGSLASQSNSLTALQIALDGAWEAGAETQMLDIRALDLPLYVPGVMEAPAAARQLCNAVAAADGLIWSSPLYHGTISGAFKNALDWLQLLSDHTPPYLTDKAVGLISTAGGVQGLQAINTMEFVVRALRGWAVPLVVPVAQAWQAFDAQGHAQDPKIDGQLRALGREVTRAARQFSLQPLTTPDAQRAEAEVEGLLLAS